MRSGEAATVADGAGRIEEWYRLEADDALAELDASREGLSAEEAGRRRKKAAGP